MQFRAQAFRHERPLVGRLLLEENARVRPRGEMTTAARSMAVVSGIAGLIVVLSVLANERYYSHHLPSGDGVGTYYAVTQAMRRADEGRALQGAAWALRTERYSLQPVLAALSASVLPRDMRVGPILNGVWFVLMAACLTALLVRQTGSVATAALLAMPPLLYPPVLTSPDNGLTNLHSDALGYMLGAAVLSLVLIDRSLADRLVCTVAGLLWGLTLYGRFPTALVLLLMVGPVLAASVYRKRSSIAGLAVLVIAAGVVAAPWLLLQLPQVGAYAAAWHGHPRGAIGLLGPSQWVLLLKGYLKWLLGADWAYAAALALLGTLARRNEARWTPQLDWAVVWMVAAPVGLLALMGSANVPYVHPAPFALFLLAVLNTGNPGAKVWRPVELALIAVAVLILAGRSLGVFWATHAEPSIERPAARVLVQTVLDDLSRRPCATPRGLTVAMTYWGVLNPYSLAVLLEMDFHMETVIRKPQMSPSVAPVTILYAVAWREPGEPESTVMERAEGVVAGAEYAIVLGPGSRSAGAHWQRDAWQAWFDFGARMRASPRFEAIGSAQQLASLEEAQALRAAGNPCGSSALLSWSSQTAQRLER